MVEDLLYAGHDGAGGPWDGGRHGKRHRKRDDTRDGKRDNRRDNSRDNSRDGMAGGSDERQQRLASARRAAIAAHSAVDWPARWASTSGNWRARS
ncbi:hypothetical protein [Rugamonas sp. DEMB1]|uniref:hypothetical protein n=1 Tax=Rugamonas sp. DEMB1 TaxID=3039386 RepID=UPI0024495734|nr:hypothetical protein [Rugamonas sp. DEMB1]WGG49409.1 hypothetical protein QC826_22960 [Rugamonas sp. DEMB1]